MMTTIQRMDWLRQYGTLHVKPLYKDRDHAWVHYTIEHNKLSWQATGKTEDDAIEEILDTVKDMLYTLCNHMAHKRPSDYDPIKHVMMWT